MSETAILLFGMSWRGLMPGSGSSEGSTGTKERPCSISWIGNAHPDVSQSWSGSTLSSTIGSNLASLLAGPIMAGEEGEVEQRADVSHPAGSSFTLWKVHEMDYFALQLGGGESEVTWHKWRWVEHPCSCGSPHKSHCNTPPSELALALGQINSIQSYHFRLDHLGVLLRQKLDLHTGESPLLCDSNLLPFPTPLGQPFPVPTVACLNIH